MIVGTYRFRPEPGYARNYRDDTLLHLMHKLPITGQELSSRTDCGFGLILKSRRDTRFDLAAGRPGVEAVPCAGRRCYSYVGGACLGRCPGFLLEPMQSMQAFERIFRFDAKVNQAGNFINSYLPQSLNRLKTCFRSTKQATRLIVALEG